MATGRLTVDLGNSRAKLRLWEGADGPATSPAATPLESPLESIGVERVDDPLLERFLGALPAGTRAALCAVGSPELEAALLGRLREVLGAAAVGQPPPGVENACGEPRTTGLDRLFAARGACEHLAGVRPAASGCLVVDAGTALTVDAVAAGGGRPRFLGGAIAPGPLLSARALASGTARLPRVEPRVGAAALGRDTEAAIRAGVAVGFRGAARELVASIAREAGFEDPLVLLSGGARAYLLEPEPFVRGALVDPELVHRGLLAALADESGP